MAAEPYVCCVCLRMIVPNVDAPPPARVCQRCLARAGTQYPDRIKCSSCGKPCSTEVPIGTKIRGYVQCEACMRDFIAASDAALAAELAQVADVIESDSEGPVTRAPGKPLDQRGTS
jgi:hypothetical protein